MTTPHDRTLAGTALTSRQWELLDHAAALIREFGRRSVEGVLGIGEQLARVKGALPHGLWLPWLEGEFGWSETTALRFVQAYRAFGKSGNLVDFNNIEVSALYLLARNGISQETRARAIEAAADGERLTHGAVRDWLELGEQDDGTPRRPYVEPAPVATLSAGLRAIDMVDSPAADVAAGIEPALRPVLAGKAERLAVWLADLARELRRETECRSTAA